jgi:hypothetical protein
MRALHFSVIAATSALLLLGAMASGCGDDPPPGGVAPDGSVTDSPNPRPDQDNTQPDGGSDTGTDGGPIKFSDYVKDLVNNQTSDTRAPDTRVNDNFVEDEDLSAYPASFFP